MVCNTVWAGTIQLAWLSHTSWCLIPENLTLEALGVNCGTPFLCSAFLQLTFFSISLSLSFYLALSSSRLPTRSVPHFRVAPSPRRIRL